MNQLRKGGVRTIAFPLPLPIVLALAFVAVAMFHGTRGLYESTEGRYAECGREMAQTGSWLEPVLEGRPHWTKPPLTYLAIRVPYQVLGPTTWAARFYLIPCFLISVACVWWLAFRLWDDRKSARMSAMVYASAAMPLISTQPVSADYLLTASLAVAQACFWESVRRRSRLWVCLFWLCMGVAFMVKGPPSLLVLPAVFAVWLRLPREERRQVPLLTPLALVLFLFVSFGWYAWEAWKHPGLMDYWLKDEVVNRSLSDKFNRNPGFWNNFTIYLPILLFGTFPWGGWLALRWRAVRERLRVPGGWRGWSKGLSLQAFWLLWAVVFPVAVFALSRSKLPLYVLPLFVPLAVAVGRLTQSVYGEEPRFRKWALVSMAFMFVAFAAGKGVVGNLPLKKDMEKLYRVLKVEHGVHDPSRLAVLSTRPLNGLGYYYDAVLKTGPLEELTRWAASGGERFILCGGLSAENVRKALPGFHVDEWELARHRFLVRVRPRSDRGAGVE